MDTLNQKRIDLIFSNYTTSRYQVLERSRKGLRKTLSTS